jgi:hypothetical protein
MIGRSEYSGLPVSVVGVEQAVARALAQPSR